MTFFSSTKEEKVVILDTGGRNDFIPHTLLATHKSLMNAPVDYHGTMRNAEIA